MPRNDSNKEARKGTTKKPTTNKGFSNDFGKPTNKKRNNQKPPTVKPTNEKTDTFVAKRPSDRYGRAYEYKMSRLCANEILKECPSRTKPQQYLCDYVTEQYGLLGWCCRVIVEA